MPDDQTFALAWNTRHLRRAIIAAGIALWAWNVDTDQFRMDARGYALWDLPPQEFVRFEDLSAKIHPVDLDKVRAAFSATRAIIGAYEIDFRIIVGGDVRWISARGQGDDADIDARTMHGIFLDVTGRKPAEEGHELLAGEMSHRVKNLLTMATALTSVTARSSHSAEEMAKNLISRLSALGRAHDLVRPLPGQKARDSLLGDLLTIVLAPYDEMQAAFSGRIRVAVPRLPVGENAATALALVIHELATNSMKYGSLSAAVGTLDVSAFAEKEIIVIVWTEGGGPAVAEPDARPSGFGSKLLTHSVAYQLNGAVEHDWRSDGLVVTIRIPKDRLSA